MTFAWRRSLQRRGPGRPWLLALVLLLVAFARPAQAIGESVEFGGTKLRFASAEQARVLLREDDDWLRATSDFQRAATLGVAPPVPLARFKEHLADTALEWSDAEAVRWHRAATALAPALTALPLPWPLEILLVQTDGRDSANAPYTRGRAVFIPRNLALQNYSDSELVAHELFHVLTRHQPALASRIYAELGFEPAGELDWPPEWAPARIANPDAPHSRHFMRTAVRGTEAAVMPLLVASRTTLTPGETFFDVLDTRLLVVVPGESGAPTRAARRADGSLDWLPVGTATAYLRRLGGNTRYIFHPEETAADNFAFLLSGRTVPNPPLLQRLERALRAPR